MKSYEEKLEWQKKTFTLKFLRVVDPISYKYKLTVAYDGTHYSGWQIQPNGVSIQQIIQQKLKILTREEVHVTGSGRTDAGVHAQGQVAHFTLPFPMDLYRLRHSLNGLLPKDIRIHDVIEVPHSFHARYSAIRKTYFYHLYLTPEESPFNRLYSWHLTQKMDLDLLKKSALYFIGTHDFAAFANESHRGSAAHDAIRTIENLNVVEGLPYVRLEFTGNGFLYKMVRNIVGTMIEVASGKRLLDDVPRIIASKDRKQAGKSAPAHGLFLMKVWYEVLWNPPERLM